MKCKHCGTRLSQYNENDYCFAHVRFGIEKEERDAREKRQKEYVALQKIRTKNIKAKKKLKAKLKEANEKKRISKKNGSRIKKKV